MDRAPTTYEKVSHLIAEYVKPVSVGAFGIPVNLYDQDGRHLSTNDDFLAGKFLILTFINGDINGARDELLSLARHAEHLEKLNAQILTISSSSDATQNKVLRRELGLSWPVLVGQSVYNEKSKTR